MGSVREDESTQSETTYDTEETCPSTSRSPKTEGNCNNPARSSCPSCAAENSADAGFGLI